VPGRKSDVLDCQWLRQLHSYGLLSGSFRPDDSICVLRSYIRQRDTLIADAARLGSPKAITATAHKLARIFYHMWTTRQSYHDTGASYYDQQYQHRKLKQPNYLVLFRELLLLARWRSLSEGYTYSSGRCLSGANQFSLTRTHVSYSDIERSNQQWSDCHQSLTYY
jgi:D-alanyl-D-alanine carboxypeptidase